MIDTITFMIHNVNKQVVDLKSDNGYSYKNPFNRLLYERLLDYESKFVFRNKKFLNNGVVDEITDDYFKRKSINNLGIVKRQGSIIESLGKKDFFFYPVHGNISTASSDSTCKFSVNENSDTLKFELSVPKYFYGHNIAQFIPNIDSDRYKKNPFAAREFAFHVKDIRVRIIEFIVTFLSDLSNLLSVHNFQSHFDLSDIEIKRLDICYNQFFASKEMAIDYLLAQKKIYHSRVKKNTIVKQDYDTSFAYRHSKDGFYFKIYHKGDEFENEDMKKLIKINIENFDSNPENLILAKSIFEKHFSKTFEEKKGKVEDLILNYYKTYVNSKEKQQFIKELESILVFKVSDLIRESNKVLRYEMSFTTTYLSTLYKREIFRSKCPDWNFLKKSYSLIKRYDLYLEKDVAIAKKFKQVYNITRDMRQEYNIIHKSLAKKHQFFLFTSKKVKKHEHSLGFMDVMEFKRNWAKAQIIDIKEATFSDDLFDLIFKRFKEEIDFFQIKEVEDTKTTIELIEKYNYDAKKRADNYVKAFGENAYKKLTYTQKRKKNLSQIQTSRLKIVLDRFNEGKSFDYVVAELALKKSAAYSLKDDLAKFNIFKNSVKTKYSFKNVKTDFSKYYEGFQLDNYAKKLFHNPLLISFDSLRKDNHHSFFAVS